MFNMNLEPQEAWMCRRNNLVYHRVTSVGEKVPKNAVEISEQFLKDMKNIGEFENLANMDETPCYFDIPRSSAIGKKRGTDS